jgi:iron(III) transport system substrate-binding protein
MSAFRNLFIFALAVTGIGTVGNSQASEINLYSYRQPVLIEPILESFAARTGIKVNVVFADKGVLERLKAEGENSPADAVLTVDVGRLQDMVDAGVLQSVRSPVLEGNIPGQFRDPEGRWFGLSVRARVIAASKERVSPAVVERYQDLADPTLRGRVCSRSGKHEYMVSLLAAMIAHDGEPAAEAWLGGMRDNLAQKPQGNDRSQIKAIYEGVCDVALVNTYYLGLLATNTREPEQQRWAEAVTIIFPNQREWGTHVNVSGAGVTKSAKNRDNAVKLIEYLSGDEGQKLYAEQNLEYPVRVGVAWHPLVASWGPFKADTINLTNIAKYRPAASRMVDRVAFDNAGGS